MIGHELSEKLSAECILQAKQFNINVNIFEAVWGKDYQEHLNKLDIKLGQVKPGKMTLGHYGNFLSHYYLWLDCIDKNEPYLILEHDGYLIRELPEDILDQFEDVCKLDSLNPYAPEYDTEVQKNIKDTVEIKTIDFIKRKKAGYYSWGVYAYIIKPVGAKKLVDWVKEKGFIATDNQVASDVLDVKTCRPSIARLHPIMAIDRNIYTLSTSRNANE
jgi:GR25 family glycosyltransferase involved in LPS biosynthesis